jgi:hypothetical protein
MLKTEKMETTRRKQTNLPIMLIKVAKTRRVVVHTPFDIRTTQNFISQTLERRLREKMEM